MSSDQQEFDFLNREECVLTLNYAWYHTIGCAVLLLYLYGVGQTSHFEAGHNFGLFAMLCDYGVMYMVKGTRTLSVVSTGVDTDDLYGIGTFLFFGWFDYLGGFALLIFARNVSDVIASRSITKTNVIVILQHVLQWSLVPYFTVPNPFHNNDGVILPPMLGIDDRTIVVSRASPKSTYGVMFLVFSILLWKTTRFTKREYCAVLVSGLACGSLHHLFLYFFGMRGYDSMLALLTTLATEWPALLCGEAYLRTAFGNNNQQKLSFDYSKQGRRFLYMVLVAILLFKLPNDEQLTEFLISVIPGQHMQSFGTTMLWMKTCVDVPMLFGRKEPLQCTREDDDSIWVISTPAKSGAVLSAKILLDIATECNFCLAMGTRESAGIPGPGTKTPTFQGKLLHALMDMDEWPQYVAEHSESNTSRCVSMTRDPLNRLRSFYTYSRSGGEHWVRYETDIMESLRSANSLQESLELFWNRIGRTYLVASHESYQNDEARGCYEIKFEDLAKDYEGTIRRILRVFGISSHSEDQLVKTLLRHDRSNLSTSQEKLLQKDMHVSSKKFSPTMIREMERILLEDIPEAGNMIRSMRKEMESLTPAPQLERL